MKNFPSSILVLVVSLCPLAIVESASFTVQASTEIQNEDEKKKIRSEIKTLVKEYKKIDFSLFQERLSLLNRILPLQEQLLGDKTIIVANTLSDIAFIYDRQGRFLQAESFYLRGIDIYEKVLGKGHPDLLLPLRDIGYLYLRRDLYKQAETYYLRALDISRNNYGENSLQVANDYEGLGDVNTSKNQMDKAESYYLRALYIGEKILGKEHPSLVENLKNMGLFYYRQTYSHGREDLFSKAETFLKKALKIQKKILEEDLENIESNDEYFDIIVELSRIWNDQELYDKIEKTFLNILDKYKNKEDKFLYIIKEALARIAEVKENQGYYNEAEEYHFTYLSLVEKNYPFYSSSRGFAYMNLGGFYYRKGLYQEGEKYFSDAIDIADKIFLPDKHYDIYSVWLNIIGLEYQLASHYDKAEEVAIKFSKSYGKAYGDKNPFYSMALNELAVINQYQSKYKNSYLNFKQAINIDLLFLHRELPYMPLGERLLLAQIESYPESQRFWDFAKEQKSSQFSIAKIGLFYRLNRHGLLEEIEKKQSLLASLAGPQQNVVDQLRIINQKISNIGVDEKERQSLKAKKEKLEKELYRLLPDLKPRIVEINDIARVMSRDSVLIEFQRYRPYREPARYLAMVLDPSEKERDESGRWSNYKIHAIDLGLAEPLEQKINQALIASEQSSKEEAELRWKEIGELVIKPLAKATEGSKTWFISPDGELNRIPFAALSGTKEEGLLVDEVKLRLLTTGRELLELEKKIEDKPNISLVVANPSFDQQQISSDIQPPEITFNSTTSQRRSGDLNALKWRPLPGTKKEGQIISEEIDATLLLEEKATAQAIIARNDPKILHIASHSFYLENQPKDEKPSKSSLIPSSPSIPLQRFAKSENPLLRSGVVLAGANKPDTNQVDDGYLTALEIAKLDWSATEMVVISGCESGQGEVNNGEGIYGLKRAIAVAGARSSLLSLWKVDDEATAAFMESFYGRLKKGVSRADALAATQKEFRGHSNQDWRHPHKWAAFQLSGDWRPIDW